MSAEHGSGPTSRKALGCIFQRLHIIGKRSFWQNMERRREQSESKGNVTKFNAAKSMGIYDTVVGKKFGIMKKYLHTTRHSM